MTLSRLIFSVLFLGMVTLLAQVYQGPAAGSVASGVSVNTNSFTTEPPARNFRPKPIKNIFINSLYAATEDMPQALAPEGANYVVDPKIRRSERQINGDFVLSNNFAGIPDQGFTIPPDPYLAVGPNHIIGVVNSRFRIMDKSGNVQKTIEASSFYSSTLSGSDPFDPKVAYDQFAQRWIMVWLHVTSSAGYFLVSVSDDADPNGVWYNWALPTHLNGTTSSGNWADYQGVGYDNQALYITSNQFTFAGSYNYAKLRIINKANLYGSSPGQVTWNDLWNIKTSSGTNVFTIRPSRHYGTGTYTLLSTSPFTTGTFVTLYKVSNPITTPTMTAVDIPVTTYNSPNDAGQLGGSQTIDGGSFYLRNEPVYRDGILHAVHAVRSGTGNLYSAVRYLALNTATNAVVSDIAMGADTYFHSYPAVEVDASNNVAITYTRSGTTQYAGAYYTSKPADVSSLTGSKLLKAGNGYYYKTFGGSRNRWGDYNGAWLDPSNTSRIYLLTEYVASTNTWGSWIGELTFSSAAAYTTVTSPNGGENWQIASTKNIEWNSSNVANVKIEYSTNNGTNWITVVASLSAAAGTFAWTVPNTPSTQCLVRISDAANSSVIDVSNGTFTISSSGQVLNWAAVISGTNGDIWGIDIVDDSVMWISADNGDVRRSTDGGNTWLSAGNPGNGAYAVAGLDANTAVVATGPSSGNGSIFRTTNGGTTWTSVYTASGAWFNFVDNFDANTLWAQSDPTDGSFHIVKSTNGGATWALTSNRPAAPASTVYGANSSFYRIGNTCWFGTGGASGSTLANRVYKSTNGADGPWTFGTAQQQFTGSLAFSTESGNGLVGYWQASNTVSRTTNGGTTWTAQATTMGLVSGLEYIHNTPIAYAAGANGLFTSLDNGATWTTDLVPTGTANLLSVRFNESGTVGFAGGAGGVLLKNIVPPVVPVEFTAFNATVGSGKVNLSWSTATESNNQGFEVQRKVNDIEDAQFITVAFKQGAGTTTLSQNYFFTDDLTGIEANSVSYRLKQIDFDGRYAYSEEILIDNVAPDKFELAQNYPNPFNPVTTINYQLPVSGHVTLKVFDALGKEVSTLVNETKTGGRYSIEFDGSQLSSGVYFYELRSGNFVSVKKLLLMK
jgi:hypothetical protein